MNKKYLKDVLEVLKSVEYAGEYVKPKEGWHYGCCPICGNVRYSKEFYHKEDCKLYKLISQTEKMLNEL